MTGKNNPFGAESGNTLVGAVILLFVTGAVGFAFLSFSGNIAQSTSTHQREMRIFWKGEEGVMRAVAHLARSPHEIARLSGTTDESDQLFAHYQALLEPDPRAIRYTITVEVFDRADEENTVLTSLVTTVAARSKGEFAFVEDRAGLPWYDTGDRIEGPMHSNSRFQVTGSPEITGVMSAAGGSPGYRCKPYANCPSLDIDTHRPIIDFGHMANRIRMTRHRFGVPTDNIAVVALRGNRYSVAFKNASQSTESSPLWYPLPQDSAVGIYFTGSVEVSGILCGVLTIGSAGNIYITGSIRYADADPTTALPYVVAARQRVMGQDRTPVSLMSPPQSGRTALRWDPRRRSTESNPRSRAD